LQLFANSPPFDCPYEDCEDPSRTATIRQKIRLVDPPFRTSWEEPVPKHILVIRECLNKNPFLRPTSSHLSQQLFEVFVAESIHAPLQPDSWTVEGPSDQLDHLAERALALATANKEKSKGNQGNQGSSHEVGEKLTTSAILPLIQATQSGNPSFSYVVGMAYLWNVVKHDEDAMDRQIAPERGIAAPTFVLSPNEVD